LAKGRDFFLELFDLGRRLRRLRRGGPRMRHLKPQYIAFLYVKWEYFKNQNYPSERNRYGSMRDRAVPRLGVRNDGWGDSWLTLWIPTDPLGGHHPRISPGKTGHRSVQVPCVLNEPEERDTLYPSVSSLASRFRETIQSDPSFSTLFL
jgi:hypothetical protein